MLHDTLKDKQIENNSQETCSRLKKGGCGRLVFFSRTGLNLNLTVSPPWKVSVKVCKFLAGLAEF